jgi:2-polyprenyl-6-hydroxyphenyl methylase/3-demethylubiquinone-9 3-methyltransferase
MTQNLDPSEVNKFNALANIWWDLNGELRTLHHINPLRLSFIDERAPLAGKKVIDIGCGGGILTESLARKAGFATGIDASLEAIKVARAHASTEKLNIDYHEITAEEFAEKHPGEFDIVTCMELLEHVPDPASVIQACATLLKPGGKVFFSTLNRTLKAYAFAVLGAEYSLRLLPKGTHDYAKFIKPSELAQWARPMLTLEELKGMDYNPFSKKASLTENVSVNYLAYFTSYCETPKGS